MIYKLTVPPFEGERWNEAWVNATVGMPLDLVTITGRLHVGTIEARRFEVRFQPRETL